MTAITAGEDAITLLRVISETMSHKLTLDEAIARVFKSICQVLEAEAGFLVILDQKETAFATKKSFILGQEQLYITSLQLDHGLVWDCINTREPIRVREMTLLKDFDPMLDGVPNVEPYSMLCTPLSLNNSQPGAIAVLNKQGDEFDSKDQDLLVSLGGVLAHMLHVTSLVQELRLTNADLEASRWELMRSRNTLRALFDNVPLSFYIIDRNYHLLAVNVSRSQRAHDIPQKLVGKKCYSALFHRNGPCPACKAIETLSKGEITSRIGHEWGPNGDSVEREIYTYPVLDESGEVSQVILSEEDVTEKRQLEYKLIQSEKLAAVGQLAAGIAHEINNPLTAVIANVQLIQRELPQDHDLQESMDLIALAGERAAQVVRNLLDLTRKENYKFIPTDLNVTIQKALDLLQHELISNAISLSYQPGYGIPEILASPEHLEGVWINLLANAFDAVDHTGKGKIAIESLRQNNQIQVTVSDNGQGIPPNRISRLFDPFYTTKSAGHGTGLGLTISQRIIKQHGGHIMVDSQIEEGTQFTVVLPIK